MNRLNWFSWLLLIGILAAVSPVSAQQEQPQGPVYIVQAGDTLGEIARRFGLSLDALLQANNLSDPNLVSEGAELLIPGLQGVQGVLTTINVPYGETLHSLSRRYGIAEADLARLNHLSSPVELYAGSDLVIPVLEDRPLLSGREQLAAGQSLLELAVLQGVNPWQMMQANALASAAQAIPGDVLLVASDTNEGPGALPGAVQSVQLDPLPFRQGRTGVVRVAAVPGMKLSGSLLDRPLNFYPFEDGSYAAIHGVQAMTPAGFYTLALNGTLPDGRSFSFSQQIGVGLVDYPYDKPLQVDPATIDPAITRPEDAQWTALMTPVTPEPYWQGVFQMPTPLSKEYCLETNDCWTSRFGNRRSYNGSEYSFFHTGLDIAGGVGVKIFAPADGVVVFAGPLTVRGNATVIDHGVGIYSGYMHQSEIYVNPGQRVQAGDLIGLVGATGRVEGPHLHWEIWAGGVQVDPLEWLRREYP